jgi:putative N6-adenine-specific DNA methylase
MYDYQKHATFFAQIAEGIKDLGVEELSELGTQKVQPEYGGIYFHADLETLYRVNYTSRLVSRVLAPILSFECPTEDILYKKAKEIRWKDFISQEKTFAIFSNVSKSKINNSRYASLRLKDAIVDSFREISGKRPDVNPKDPDLWFNLHIRNDRAVISLDTSGGSLHRRGYRKDSVEAPMQETVAAAIIQYSEWDGSVPLYDPMCGSGTLISEALMHYCRIPSGIHRRRFGFEYLPDYDSSSWRKTKTYIDQEIRELPDGLIYGSDISQKAVKVSRKNINSLPYGDKITIEKLDFRESHGLENGVIITNPPYGIRTGDKEDLVLLYKYLGDFLKQKCMGSTAYIYCGEREFIKNIRLKTAWKKPLKTGGLDGRLVKYELF